MPKLTIDNREIQVPAGTKVIEAAERLGIMIPRFCFHPALGSVGACRVCAVAFTEGPVKGIQMSCMIDVQDGMVVSTTDAEAVDFRRHVIEWLMLHHPHDCPVCDEGGHCLLQDLTVAGGHGLRRFKGLKRTHNNQDLGPLVQHEMNRCIQCYRCSRFYQEFTGYRDLGVMGIGSRVYFGRSASGVLESPFAGNLTDICPTGVYTDKPSRYFGRRWDYQRHPSLCLHCSLGCNLMASARYRRVVRHEARPNLNVNGHFLCDRGRYGYAYAGATDRPRQAMAAGSPGPIVDILAGAREAIQKTVAQHGPESVAVVTSSRSNLETLAVLKQACERRVWTGPATAPTDRQALNQKTAIGCLRPELAVSLAADTEAHDVLVIGADPLNEAPMLALSLRQVQRCGGHVTVIDPRGVRLPFDFDHWAVHPAAMGAILQALIHEIGGNGTAAAGVSTTFDVTKLARRLNASPRPVVICGTDILTSWEIALAGDLAQALCRTHKVAGLFYTLTGANAFAAALAQDGRLSTETVLDRIEDGRVRLLVAVEQDLWHEFPDRKRLQAALKQLDHLVLLDYINSPMNHEANFFIPTQPIYESGGHWINQEGRLQVAAAVIAGGEPIEITGGLDHPPRVFESRIPGDEPLAAWRAVAALAEDYGKAVNTTQEETLKSALANFHPAVDTTRAAATGQRIDLNAVSHTGVESAERPVPAANGSDSVVLLLVDWTFGTETMSAMSPTLAKVEASPVARMHPDTISGLELSADQAVTVFVNENRLTMPLKADPGMASGVMVVPRHHLIDWQVLGETRVILAPSQLKAEST